MRWLVPLLLLVPGVAAADRRTVPIGTIDRVRIEGPLTVTIVTGGSPALLIEGGRDAIEALDVHADGTVLAIRARGGAPSTRRDTATPIAVTVTTPALRSLLVVGGASVSAGAMKGDAVDISLSGTGTVTVASITAGRFAATLIGNGMVAVGGGYAGSARLVGNGAGTIDAAGFEAGELVAHVDGPGTVKVRARYTAQVIDTGLGQVSIGGRPKCTVRAQAGGPVSCGDAD